MTVEVVGHEEYAREHGHRPRGYGGGWLFSPVDPYARDSRYMEHLSPSFRGTFTEASKAARAWAKGRGFDTLWVCP